MYHMVCVGLIHIRYRAAVKTGAHLFAKFRTRDFTSIGGLDPSIPGGESESGRRSPLVGGRRKETACSH